MEDKVLCELPRIVVFDKFLSTEEIEGMLKLGEGLWQSSTVVDNTSGQSVVDSYRTGKLAHLNTIKNNTMMEKIREQTAAMLKVRPAQIEGFQLVQYGVGDQYKVHHDWFDPKLPGPKLSLKTGGQRTKSMIVCLKQAEEGGETEFPNLDIKVKLEPGQAVVFDNLNPDGTPTTLTDHAGLPIIKGEKIIIPIWVRERAADGSEEDEAKTAKEIATQKIAEAKAKAKAAAEEAERAEQVEAEHRVSLCAKGISDLLERHNCRLWAQPHVTVNPQNGVLQMSATVELNSMPNK